MSGLPQPGRHQLSIIIIITTITTTTLNTRSAKRGRAHQAVATRLFRL